MSFANSTYFEIFGLPESFDVHQNDLDEAYHTVQAQIHPDRFASEGALQKRIATQWSTRVNDAYQTLKDPLKRAIYLLHLRGIELGEEQGGGGFPADFLMQQIAWRERIEAASTACNDSELDSILNELEAQQDVGINTFAQCFDANENAKAADTAHELMFLDRLVEQVQSALHSIEANSTHS